MKQIFCADCKKLIGELEKGSKILKNISYRCSICEEKIQNIIKINSKNVNNKDDNYDFVSLLKMFSK